MDKIDLIPFQGRTECQEWADVILAEATLHDSGMIDLEFKGTFVEPDEKTGIKTNVRCHGSVSLRAAFVQDVTMSFYEDFFHYRLHLDDRLLAVGEYDKLLPIKSRLIAYLNKHKSCC